MESFDRISLRRKDKRSVARCGTWGKELDGIAKPATSHTFRHSLAIHGLENGYDIRPIQEWIGSKDVKTTIIYTHVLKRGGRRSWSPADTL
ncbi:MAG: tyrosine-type recombinase/integrase [Acidobacteria bacterium]|nr:tyrosine-type recombinase/integrase [Acidobacteriota bacterium]MBI3658759.1 tyrosine-type recombinase/integrase [Acidobacteriota bacterium]